MIDIYLIRHGKASSGWDNLNPDLGIIGKKQSKKIATELLNIAKEPYDIFSSPLISCLEPAAPFSEIANKRL